MEAGSLSFVPAQQPDEPARCARRGCCVRARIGDWMRVGELLANDGVFEGNQFTPPRYVTLMLKPDAQGFAARLFTRVDGAFATHDVAWLEGTTAAAAVDRAVAAARDPADRR